MEFNSPQFSAAPGKVVWIGDTSKSFAQQSATGGATGELFCQPDCVRRPLPSSSTICEFSRGQLLVTDAVPGLSIVTPDHGCWSNVAFQFRRSDAVGVATGRLLIFEQSSAADAPEVPDFSAYEAVLSDEGQWWCFPPELVLRPATCYCLLAESVMPFAIGSGAPAGQMLAADAPGRPFQSLSGFAPLFCLRGTPIQPLPITWLRDSVAAV